MPDRKRDPLPPPIGGASLLAAFAVLCLTVFALLSLSTVRADDRLGKATVQAVTDYYAADLEAQTILARLRNGELSGPLGRRTLLNCGPGRQRSCPCGPYIIYT